MWLRKLLNLFNPKTARTRGLPSTGLKRRSSERSFCFRALVWSRQPMKAFISVTSGSFHFCPLSLLPSIFVNLTIASIIALSMNKLKVSAVYTNCKRCPIFRDFQNVFASCARLREGSAYPLLSSVFTKNAVIWCVVDIFSFNVFLYWPSFMVYGCITPSFQGYAKKNLLFKKCTGASHPVVRNKILNMLSGKRLIQRHDHAFFSVVIEV